MTYYNLFVSFNDILKQGEALQARLGRVKELYEWGHKTKDEYFTDCVAIQRELKQLKPFQPQPHALENLADFLKNIVLAWDHASQKQVKCEDSLKIYQSMQSSKVESKE